MQRLDLTAATPSIPRGIWDQDVSLPSRGGALKCSRECNVSHSFFLLLLLFLMYLLKRNALIKSTSCPIEFKNLTELIVFSVLYIIIFFFFWGGGGNFRCKGWKIFEI